MSTKIYVGDLGTGGTQADLEEEFGRYGAVEEVWVARNPPGFAFVHMTDYHDAEDAVRGLDGKRICGSRIRVEISHGRSRPKPRGFFGGEGPPRDMVVTSSFRRRRRSRGRDGSRSPSPRRRYRSRSRERYRRRSYSKSRSRSPPRRSRPYSRRSRSPPRRYSRSKSPRSFSRSRSRSRSRGPRQD